MGCVSGAHCVQLGCCLLEVFLAACVWLFEMVSWLGLQLGLCVRAT